MEKWREPEFIISRYGMVDGSVIGKKKLDGSGFLFLHRGSFNLFDLDFYPLPVDS